MSLVDKDDWKLWFSKIKWQLISFKFLSFWSLVSLLVLSWLSLIKLHEFSIERAKLLYKDGYLDKADVSKIITHSQSVLFDNALSHLLIFFATLLGAIVAIKGVSYWTDSKQTSEVIKKLNGDTTKEDLKKFLPDKRK